MKRSKFRRGTLVFSLAMAVNLVLPLSVSGQGGGADGFFKGGSVGYENRDGDVSGGITNESFDAPAPLDGGLLIMLAAGVGYALRKRKRLRGIVTGRVMTCAMLLALLLGTTQCKKNVTDFSGFYGNCKNITLAVERDSRADVNPVTGAVSFVDVDEIIVANNGKYVGRLVYGAGVFAGGIANADASDYLHFYFLGNQDVGELTAGSSDGFSVVISDQVTSLPVISYGVSTEKYSPSVSSYTACLRNKCALAKFEVSTSSTYAATCVKGMNNKVEVCFSDASFSYSQVNEGKITIAPGNGTRYAILLPQDAVAEGGAGSAFSGRYSGTRGAVPEITANACITDGIPVVINEPMVPEGAINALFTVNADGKQVYFSKANLSYLFEEKRWEFLPAQYTTYEKDAENVGEEYYKKKKATLFCWGTSGYNHGANYHMPYNTSDVLTDYNVYGDPTKNIFDEDGRADWGYNEIYNGGMTNKQWRVLTHEEWVYLMEERDDALKKRGGATINGKKGFVLLPDDWTEPYEGCFVSGYDNSFATNTYTLAEWAMMENAGAVFLATAGRRCGTGCFGTNKYLFIWTSSVFSDQRAYCMFVNSSTINPNREDDKRCASSVRLVCE